MQIEKTFKGHKNKIHIKQKKTKKTKKTNVDRYSTRKKITIEKTYGIQITF